LLKFFLKFLLQIWQFLFEMHNREQEVP